MRDVTDSIFERDVTHSECPVLVDFYSSWCAPCTAMLPILEEIEKEYPSVKFVKMNVDDNETIPAMVGIRSIPALALFNAGEMITLVTGAKSKAQIEVFLMKRLTQLT